MTGLHERVAGGEEDYSPPTIVGNRRRSPGLSLARDADTVALMYHCGGFPKRTWRAVHDAGLFDSAVNIAEGKGLTDECVITLVDAGVTFMVLSVSSNSECRRVSTALVLGSD
ncbi:hypothetical protein [Microbacterium sp. LWH10-1.2]|uniref:hypothetical protein n=1 Tax=Microbacterium sp. LWH10-1.2 TaxID=3135255 RepID=UPI0031397A35